MGRWPWSCNSEGNQTDGYAISKAYMIIYFDIKLKSLHAPKMDGTEGIGWGRGDWMEVEDCGFVVEGG